MVKMRNIIEMKYINSTVNISRNRNNIQKYRAFNIYDQQFYD